MRYEITDQLVARFGASKTIGRQNYNLLGSGFGTPTCNAQGCQVTGPNPDLKPLYAKNIDVSLGWYFARLRLGEAWPRLLAAKSATDPTRKRAPQHAPRSAAVGGSERCGV